MTTRLHAVVALALGAVVAAACEHDDLNYCLGAPFDNCMNLTCVANNDCSAPTPVCDVDGTKACVQCLAPDQTNACTGTAPVCSDDHTCRGCSAHRECPASDVCLPGGRCAEPNEVAYVQVGGAGAQPCAKEAPCGTLQEGVTAVAASRPYIKISGSGTLADNATTTIDGKAVTILADPGAKLDRTGDGVILEVRNAGADVQIYDLEISGASGTGNGFGISIPAGATGAVTLTRVKVNGNQAGGISSAGSGTLTVAESTISGNTGGGVATTAGTLIISQSAISGNTGISGPGISTTGGTLRLDRSMISGNQGGGVFVGVGVGFRIVNNYIIRNGDPDNGAFGGLSLGVAIAGSNRLEFNTIADNRAAINSGGVVCNVSTLSAPNNIIARNALGMSTTAPDAQEAGACMYPSSRIQSDVIGLAFVDAEVPAPFDYKLTAASSAIDQAVTPSDIDIDNDGDARPQRTQKDIGADEFKP